MLPSDRFPSLSENVSSDPDYQLNHFSANNLSAGSLDYHSRANPFSKTKWFELIGENELPEIRGLKEEIEIDECSGRLKLKVPLPISRTRDQFQPKLDMYYEPNQGNGPFGLGWKLSIPDIKRTPGKPSSQNGVREVHDSFFYNDNDYLIPKIDTDNKEKLLTEKINGFTVSYYWLEKDPLNARFEKWENEGHIFWKVINNDNVISIYGDSYSGCIYNPEAEDEVYSWLLVAQYDLKGNAIVYEYKEDRNEAANGKDSRIYTQQYIKRIKYGNTVPYLKHDPEFEEGGWKQENRWMFELVFDYGEHSYGGLGEVPRYKEFIPWEYRDDSFSGFQAGFDIRTRRLCYQILGFHNFERLGPDPYLVQSFQFTYFNDPSFALMTSLRLSRYEENGNFVHQESFPPLTFEYATPKMANLDATKKESFSFFKMIRETSAQVKGWYQRRNFRKKVTSPSSQSLSIQGQNQNWSHLQYFKRLPSVDWNDADLRLIDLFKEDQPDMLLTNDDLFVWSKERFIKRLETLQKEIVESGMPHVLFEDSEIRIYLADMTGDGDADIVRIKNGGVDYWANLGHGRFSRKISMKGCTPFCPDESFDTQRLHLIDVNGTGFSDLVYLDEQFVKICFNQSGNQYSAIREMKLPRPVDQPESTVVFKSFRSNAVCISWKTEGTEEQEKEDLIFRFGSPRAPYTLKRVKNNIGGEIKFDFSFLPDFLENEGFHTERPFPKGAQMVKLLKRLEYTDKISPSRLVYCFDYKGFFRYGEEGTEFGFRSVDKWTFPFYPTLKSIPPRIFSSDRWEEKTNANASLVRSYFFDRELMELSTFRTTILAKDGNTQKEIILEPHFEKPTYNVSGPPGELFRQECFHFSGKENECFPTLQKEYHYSNEVLQHKFYNLPIVNQSLREEELIFSYEQSDKNPRIQQKLVLEWNEYGQPKHQCYIGYPKKEAGFEGQFEFQLLFEKIIYQHINEKEGYFLLNLPVEQKQFVVEGIRGGGEKLLEKIDMIALWKELNEQPSGGTAIHLHRHHFWTYYSDDLSEELPFGKVGKTGLLYRKYTLAFFPAGLKDYFPNKDVTPGIMSGEGGFIFRENHWWLPSDLFIYNPNFFYRIEKVLGPTGEEMKGKYDPYSLFLIEKEKVFVADREKKEKISLKTNLKYDYRLLKLRVIISPNGNKKKRVFNTLGNALAMAYMGKKNELNLLMKGDDLKEEDIQDATIRYNCSCFEWLNEEAPNYIKVQNRENHIEPTTNWLETYFYFNGFGHIVQQSKRATKGPVNQKKKRSKKSYAHRWIIKDRMVRSVDGRVIKVFLPFFSKSSAFLEEEIMKYNPGFKFFQWDGQGRISSIQLSDGTYSKIERHPWRVAFFDANDTLKESQWLSRQKAKDQNWQNIIKYHTNTPHIAHLSPNGWVVVLEEQLLLEEDRRKKVITQIKRNISGQPLEIIDAKNNTSYTIEYNHAGQRICHWNLEVGRRLNLLDYRGNRIREWDAKDRKVEWKYDNLGRLSKVFVTEGGERSLVELLVYGEEMEKDQGIATNSKGRLILHFDMAGLVKYADYDFKGNITRTERKLLRSHQTIPHWEGLLAFSNPASYEAQAVTLKLLETTSWEIKRSFNAFNKVEWFSQGGEKEVEHSYDEAGRLKALSLKKIDGSIDPFILNIDYNPRDLPIQINYANGVTLEYSYDKLKPLLTRLVCFQENRKNLLQDISFTYDFKGNLLEIKKMQRSSREQQAQFCFNSLEQLTYAEGKMQIKAEEDSLGINSLLNISQRPIDRLNLIPFKNTYSYDEVGNLIQMDVEALYLKEQWIFSIDPEKNQVKTGAINGKEAFRITYDEHGNMKNLPKLAALHWNYKDQLAHAIMELDSGDTVCPVESFYQYNAEGKRIRKLVIYSNQSVKERIYLGHGHEVLRHYNSINAFEKRKIGEEVQTISFAKNNQPYAAIESLSIDKEKVIPEADQESLIRYFIPDHLGSVILELDEKGEIQSYEEYFPYGGTAIWNAISQKAADRKRYRYRGMEKDTELGLYYQDAHYYAAYLARWCTPYQTPLFYTYSFLTGNPLTFTKSI